MTYSMTEQSVTFKNFSQLMEDTRNLIMSNTLVDDEGGTKREFDIMYQGSGESLSNYGKIKSEQQHLQVFEAAIVRQDEAYSNRGSSTEFF